MECRGVLPTTQFAYRNGLGTCDTLLTMANTLQSALVRGREAKIVQIDFSAAFDRVDRKEILFGRFSLGVGGSVLSVLTQFISNRTLCRVHGWSNWLTCCQECREVFCVSSCSSCTQRASLHSGEQALRWCWRLHFGSCGAISWRESRCYRIPESWS